MGALCSGLQAGKRIPVHRNDSFDGLQKDRDAIEIRGFPLSYYISDIWKLSAQNQERVNARIQQDLCTAAKHQSEDVDRTGHLQSASSRAPSNSGGVFVTGKRQAHVATISWNVGAIGDHMKKRGTTLEADQRSETIVALTAAFRKVHAAGEVDCIVVGLQECISLTVSNANALRKAGGDYDCHNQFLGIPEGISQWVDMMQEAVDLSTVDGKSEPFVLYGRPVFLFGMLMCVFCQAEHVIDAIAEYAVYKLPTDKYNAGFKGCVAVRFSLFDRSFCFVNCHLEALTGKKESDNRKAFLERIETMKQGWETIAFQINRTRSEYPLYAHRTVFCLGDFNMRLFAPEGYKLRKELRPEVMAHIEQGSWKELWDYDQLVGLVNGKGEAMELVEEDARLVGKLWREPVPPGEGPNFAPTFKLEVHPKRGYSEKRVPAWTDRVIYRGHNVSPKEYSSVEQDQIKGLEKCIADHNPVVARFHVECEVLDRQALVRFIRALRNPDPMIEADSKASVSLDERVVLKAQTQQQFRRHVEVYADDLCRRLKRLEPDAAEQRRQALLEFTDDYARITTQDLQRRMQEILDGTGDEAPAPKVPVEHSHLEGALTKSADNLRQKIGFTCTL